MLDDGLTGNADEQMKGQMPSADSFAVPDAKFEASQDRLHAIAKWLDVDDDPAEVTVLTSSFQDTPQHFLSTHIGVLPPHLLQPLLGKVSVQQRGTIPLVARRRRNYADQPHSDENPLAVRVSSHRLPWLWKALVNKDVAAALDSESSAQDAREGKSLSSKVLPDPPFPDHPAANVPGYQDTPAAKDAEGRPRYGPPHQGDLFSHPRIVRLMEEQDCEERRGQSRQTGEEDSSDDSVSSSEPADDRLNGLEIFREAVIERFVQGDVSVRVLDTRHRLVLTFSLTHDRLRSLSPCTIPSTSTGHTIALIR